MVFSTHYSISENFTTDAFPVSENETADEGAQGFTLTEQIILGIVLASFVVIAALGNALVIVAVFTDGVLKRKKNNFFFVSLAFADIFVGLIVMPFALINTLLGKWLFGTTFCLIWLCFDITCSTASILSLCVICLDRTLQISRALHYEAYITDLKIYSMIAMIWVLSAILSFVPLHLGWHLPPVDQRAPADPSVCILDISFMYALASSTISFYVPSLIIVCLYTKVYMVTKKHAVMIDTQKLSVVQQSPKLTEKRLQKQIYASLKRAKATLTLGVIVGVFFVCWLPFFIINPILAKCFECLNPILIDIFTWMGYINSCANPIIYPLLNRDFRRAFHNILQGSIQAAVGSGEFSSHLSAFMPRSDFRRSSLMSVQMTHTIRLPDAMCQTQKTAEPETCQEQVQEQQRVSDTCYPTCSLAVPETRHYGIAVNEPNSSFVLKEGVDNHCSISGKSLE